MKLKCDAQGNPQPTIVWSRRGARLPTGDESTEVLTKLYHINLLIIITK